MQEDRERWEPHPEPLAQTYNIEIEATWEWSWDGQSAHASLLQGNRAPRLKRRFETLPRAHTENRWELYKASSERHQRRRPLRTPKKRKGEGITLSICDVTAQERRETWRERNSDYRRVLGAGHRRPSPETIRRPHTTTTADRQPYSNRNHNRRALRKSPKVPLDLAGWRMRRLTGPQAKTELRRHRTTSTPLQNDSLKARPPDLKRGALQPRSRAPTAGRGPDREKWKPHPIAAAEPLKPTPFTHSPPRRTDTPDQDPPTADRTNHARGPNQNTDQDDGEEEYERNGAKYKEEEERDPDYHARHRRSPEPVETSKREELWGERMEKSFEEREKYRKHFV